jgi:hypothetical protein
VVVAIPSSACRIQPLIDDVRKENEMTSVNKMMEVIRNDLRNRTDYPIKDLSDQNAFLVGYLSGMLIGYAAVDKKITEDIEWRIKYHTK